MWMRDYKMDKPLPMYKDDLQQRKTKGRKGILKHFILRHDLDKLVTDYAKKLGFSQARVIEEMIELGIVGFEKKYGFRIVEKSIDYKRDSDLTEEINEKEARIREQRQRESAKKANDLAEAHSKRIIHDYSGEDWQSEWFV